jgi:H+-transporting ATPase
VQYIDGSNGNGNGHSNVQMIEMAENPMFSSGRAINASATSGKAAPLTKSRSDSDMDFDNEDAEKNLMAANFVYSSGLSSEEATRLLGIHGPNVLPEKKVPKWYIFVSLLWQPMPLMIWAASIVEAAIENWIDMSILLFIQFANASIGFYEITKAGDAVDALKKSLQPKATVKRDGKWMEIHASHVVPGDMVLLASGSAVPADCRVNKGTIDVDQAALTGESLPVTMKQGDSCKMGSTVVRGETEGTVEFTGINTFFGKTAALLKVMVYN